MGEFLKRRLSPRHLIIYLSIFIVSSFYICVFYQVLHPNVSPEYQSYYIDRSTNDWHPEKYVASLEDGIDFSRSGYPEFVDFVTGLSDRESWGRWSDANLHRSVSIRYVQPSMSGMFCLAIKMSAARDLVGKDVLVIVGDQKSYLHINSLGQNWYKFQGRLDKPTYSVEIQPMYSTLEVINGRSFRRLGVGLNRLVFVNKACDKL